MNDIAIEETRQSPPSEQAIRNASDKLCKAVIRAYEHAFGERICKTCNAKLPANTEHYRPREDYFRGLSPRCRACADGHSSWAARRTKIEHRKAISQVKQSDEWVQVRRTRNTAVYAAAFYIELSNAVWWAWDYDIPEDELGEKLYEIAERHNNVDFLQRYSNGFVALTEGGGEPVDLPDLAREWEHYYRKWQGKWRSANATLERLEATFT